MVFLQLASVPSVSCVPGAVLGTADTTAATHGTHTRSHQGPVLKELTCCTGLALLVTNQMNLDKLLNIFDPIPPTL